MFWTAPYRAKSSAFLAISACFLAGAAEAQDASPWVSETHSAVRLIAGSRNALVLMGGIAFKLQPGWKTYWRTPGDSGVPPRFDFSGSENVESVTVLWPAPTSFADGSGGFSFGYKEQVVLPLRIAAKNPDKPVTLRSTVSYAVCDRTCVPIEAKLELPFISTASTEDRALAAALAAVPMSAKIGGSDALTVRDVKRDGKQQIVVDVAVPEGTSVQLFAEGPTQDWALPPPALIGPGAKGTLRFGFELDGLPPNTKPEGAELKLTLVGNSGPRRTAYEFSARIGPPNN